MVFFRDLRAATPPSERSQPLLAAFTRRSFLTAAGASLATPALLTGAFAQATKPPLHFTHAFGEITLPRPARRVVSLGYTTHDALLALGVVPLAIRYWYGNYPYGVWPWAQSYLGDAKPELLVGEVPMEKVAALAPDLIVAIGSGISHAEYKVLSQIAPVLMHDASYAAFGTPWTAMTETIGKAVGKDGEAAQLIRNTHQMFTDAQTRHPHWAGKTAVAANYMGGESSAFIKGDTRATFLRDLGFGTPQKLKALSSVNSFYLTLSPEDLTPLDADVLVWISAFEAAPDLVNLPMRKTLTAHKQGREVFAGPLVSGALSMGSVLSIPFALKRLESDLAAAADGDPSTPVASAVKAGLTS